jgi:outer membrane receptor protein involved in Fe transport
MKGRFAGVEVLGTEPNYVILIRKTPILQGRSSKPGSNPGNPLILIDGNHATFEDLKNMPVNFIERIDVLKSAGATSIFGMEGFDGVINLITRTGGSAAFKTLVEYSANIRISGYHAARIFYSPIHSADSNSDYKPDLRSTLLWKPDINLKDNNGVIVNYFNGDNSSNVRVIAEGITSAGIPVTGKAEYVVR